IIYNNQFSYYFFIKQNCESKSSIANRKRVEYVYSEPFNCDDFEVVGRNSYENLVLYKYAGETLYE
ncbi:MAG: hypothetical protein PF488_04390, partial [Patescibacteria group bacterium]|nr:hypothetical protein [Patescibacteria group bacterium]